MGCGPSSTNRVILVTQEKPSAMGQHNNNARKLSIIPEHNSNRKLSLVSATQTGPEPVPTEIHSAGPPLRPPPPPPLANNGNVGEGTTERTSQEAHHITLVARDTTTSTSPVPEKLTEAVVNEFVELDKDIQKLEAERTEEKLALHQLECTNVEEALKAKQTELEQLKANMQGGVDINCSLYMQKQNLPIMTDKRLSLFMSTEGSEKKENLQYLESKNKVEVCEKEIEVLKEKQQKISKSVEIFTKEVEELTSKRLMLNGLLENIFNGDYGSDLENRLELETEQMLQMKQHFSTAHYKWWHGRVLISHAVSQMAFACKQWKQIQSGIQQGIINEARKFELATGARNSIVAALQNCVRTTEYLKTNLPYWNVKDHQNMVCSVNRLYTDLMTNVTFEQAYSWFYYYHQRLGLQLNWMDQVINNKIVPDYQRVSKDFKAKHRELRMERLKLLQSKAKEILQIEMDIEPFLSAPENETNEEDFLPTVEPDTATEELVDGAILEIASLPRPSDETISIELISISNETDDDPATGSSRSSSSSSSSCSSTEDASKDKEGKREGEDDQEGKNPPIVRRISLSDLAPAPDDNELFGNVKQLEIMHRKNMEEFDKAQVLNKAQQEEGLKEKLRERQSRRRKQQLQQIQATALSTHVSPAQ